MMHQLLFVLVLGCIFPTYLLSPLSRMELNQHQQLVSDDVKELENLRNENSKPTNTSDNSHPSVAGIEPEVSQPLPTPLPNVEEPQANSRSAIFRHRGITEAKKSRGYWNKSPQQPSDGYAKFAGIQYSPSDLAAYVFTTGDEEGVAVAVEELVREGMMGRTDAINYLQDVKQNLAYLESEFEHQKKLEELKSRLYAKPELTQMLPNSPREQFISDMDTDKRDSKAVEAPSAPAITTEQPQQVVIASTSEPKGPSIAASTTTAPKPESADKEVTDKEAAAYKDEDSKRRVPPRNTNTFTIEVIYKLAKDMFTQSILRDDPTAEDTLTGLVSFLESEVGNKRISPEQKEKVLEIVSAALVDSLREYQGYLSENQGPMYEESGIYQNMADNSGSLSVSKVPMSEIYRKLAAQGHDNMLPITSKTNRPISNSILIG